VLWVDSQPPLPLDNGARLRSYHLAREASRHCELGFLTFATQPGTSREPVSREALLELMPDLAWAEPVRTPRVPKRLAQAVTSAGGPSWSLTIHRSRHLRDAIRRAVLSFRPSVVHFNDLFLVPYRSCAGSGAVTVMAPHNIESLGFERMAATASAAPRRWLYRREAARLGLKERQLLSRFDSCLAVSELEAETFRSWGASSVCIPNGCEPQPPPEPPRRLADGEPLRLLFVGTGGYQPNLTGLEWFRDQVIPHLNGLEVEVTVVGQGWDEAAWPAFHCAGRVQSVLPYYERADVAIVPLLAGGGTRLKLVEALSLGTLVATTSIGCEGFPIRDRREAVVADDAGAFSAALASIAQELRVEAPTARERQLAGYGLATQLFWPVIGERLSTHYEQLIHAT
jgi:Glycosyl transferases group 1/Glycosyltransferase Family 4